MYVKELKTSQQMDEASQLEAVIWGCPDPCPRSLLMVFAHHGGAVIGAYDVDRLVGISVGFPGLDGSRVTYLHSHILGVLPGYRNGALGRILKEAQWKFAEGIGFPYVGWTYDPLQQANAWFNLEVLGAEVADVIDDAYGPLDDALNRGMPSHRFFVRWSPGRPKLRGCGEPQVVEIPLGLAELRARDPVAAHSQNEEVFGRLASLWADGYRITGVVKEDGKVRYLWHPEVECQRDRIKEIRSSMSHRYHEPDSDGERRGGNGASS